jgi:isoquinoline 1-oxidoreductase beta subunit
VGRDGVVTVSVPQLEMGQGVLTVLAQIAAVELGADWRQVGVEIAPVPRFMPIAAGGGMGAVVGAGAGRHDRRGG